MLIFLRHELAFLATPKTGSTAIEFALRPYAEVIFARNRKHIPAKRFKFRIAPFMEKTFGTRPRSVAIMRDPVEQIRSWYRYRTNPRLAGSDLHTADIDFETYVREVCSDSPPERARLGSQFSFLSDKEGRMITDHVFAYDNIPAFLDFMSGRLGEQIVLKERNVSPAIEAPLSDEGQQMLRTARADEFALYDRICAAGGHLHAT
ncbi:MAG: hypothetical protein WBB25_13570 [Sulfitobacter sp.]